MKEWTLSLYNAINRTSYMNPDEIEDAVYMGMKNDTSFLVTNMMNFWEQQQAPVSKCVRFYNGTPNKADRTILKLSDSFPEGSVPDIEVKATI